MKRLKRFASLGIFRKKPTPFESFKRALRSAYMRVTLMLAFLVLAGAAGYYCIDTILVDQGLLEPIEEPGHPKTIIEAVNWVIISTMGYADVTRIHTLRTGPGRESRIVGLRGGGVGRSWASWPLLLRPFSGFLRVRLGLSI